jgi:hypothetical protein
MDFALAKPEPNQRSFAQARGGGCSRAILTRAKRVGARASWSAPTESKTWRQIRRFMGSFNLQHWTRIGAMNLPSEFVLVPRPSSSSSGSTFWRRDGFEDEEEDGSPWLKNSSWEGMCSLLQASSWFGLSALVGLDLRPRRAYLNARRLQVRLLILRFGRTVELLSRPNTFEPARAASPFPPRSPSPDSTRRRRAPNSPPRSPACTGTGRWRRLC